MVVGSGGCASAAPIADGYRLTVGAVVLNHCSAQVASSSALLQCARPIVSRQSMRMRDETTRTITVFL
jgi:hypothetical protein